MSSLLLRNLHQPQQSIKSSKYLIDNSIQALIVEDEAVVGHKSSHVGCSPFLRIQASDDVIRPELSLASWAFEPIYGTYDRSFPRLSMVTNGIFFVKYGEPMMDRIS